MGTLLYVGLGNAVAATVLALVVAPLARLCRGRPALVRGLWLLVLLRLLAPPLVSPRIALPSLLAPAAEASAGGIPNVDPQPPAVKEATPDVHPGPAAPAGDDLAPDPVEIDLEPATDLSPAPVATEPQPAPSAGPSPPAPLAAPFWQQAVLVLWLTGSLLWWAVAARRLHRFGRMARHARSAPAEVQETARLLAPRLGLACCPPVLFVPGHVPPLLWGVVGRARVLLPAALWARLTAEQRETLLAHELAHLRRGDHWVRRLELVVLGLYWWHPVVWWARRRIQEAEEQCCDAWVVAALPEAAVAYARALLTTIAFLSDTRAALPVGASGIGQVPVLKRRLAMILRGTTPRGLSRAGLVAVMGLGAVLLPLLPTWGQTPAPGEKPAANRTAPPASDPRPAPPAGTPDGPQSGRPDAAGHTSTQTSAGAPRFDSVVRPSAGYEEQPAGAATAEEQVELLKAQLDVRRAELEEAKALLAQANRQAARTEDLFKRGAVDSALLDNARTEVTILEARLRGKEARVREAELQLRQAQRRSGWSHPVTPPPAASGQHSYESATPPPVVRPPSVPPAKAPVDSASPPPAAGSSAAPVPAPHRPTADTEARLRALEKKIDALLHEVESLRREVHPPRGSTSVPGDVAPPAVKASPAAPGR